MASAEPVKLRAATGAANSKAAPQAPARPGGGALLRVFKLLLAVALLPACVGATQGVYHHFVTVWSTLNLAAFGPGQMLKWFALGGICFAVFAILLWRAVTLYVFGHELVHALAAWLCLGKVSNLRASAKGGQVTTSKSNTFIRLAPYCVPLYALLAAGLYLALNAWWRPMHPYALGLAFALGFFYAFHLGFTLWSLRRDQPDLQPDGWLFSLVVIYLANLAVFVVVMGFVCGQEQGVWPALRASSQLGWQCGSAHYLKLNEAVRQLIQR